MLVLQRVKSSVTSPSDRPSPTSSGGGSREDECDKRSALLQSYSGNPKPTSPSHVTFHIKVRIRGLVLIVGCRVRRKMYYVHESPHKDSNLKFVYVYMPDHKALRKTTMMMQRIFYYPPTNDFVAFSSSMDICSFHVS